MTDSSLAPANENARQTRSIPGTFYVHIRCLHCGELQSVTARSAVDMDARHFLKRMSDHTRETGHKVEVITTEAFCISQL